LAGTDRSFIPVKPLTQK